MKNKDKELEGAYEIEGGHETVFPNLPCPICKSPTVINDSGMQWCTRCDFVEK